MKELLILMGIWMYIMFAIYQIWFADELSEDQAVMHETLERFYRRKGNHDTIR